MDKVSDINDSEISKTTGLNEPDYLCETKDFTIKNGVLLEYNGADAIVRIPSCVTVVGDAAFRGNGNIYEIIFEKGLVYVGSEAFQNCSSLKTVRLPDTLKAIEKNAFEKCSSLNEVYTEDLASWCKIKFENQFSNPLSNNARFYSGTEEISLLSIPEKVSSVGNFAFYGCTSISSVFIPESTVSIGFYAFAECPSLQDVQVAPSNQDFASVDGLLYSKNMKTLILCPPAKTGSVSVVKGVQTLARGAISKCKDLYISLPFSTVIGFNDDLKYNCKKYDSKREKFLDVSFVIIGIIISLLVLPAIFSLEYTIFVEVANWNMPTAWMIIVYIMFTILVVILIFGISAFCIVSICILFDCIFKREQLYAHECTIMFLIILIYIALSVSGVFGIIKIFA